MRFLGSLIIFLFALRLNAAQFHKPFGQLKIEQKFKDYAVRIYQNDLDTTNDAPDYACFEILRLGKQVYFKTGFKFKVGDFFDEGKTNVFIKIGHCLTKDKQPNLVVSEWCGGAHCCYTFHIFQIGDTFKLMESIDLQNSTGSFKDLRGDGDLRLIIQDWTFQYWNACFAESFAPDVILRYVSGKYRPDLELLKKPAPTQKTLEKMASEFKPMFASKWVKGDPNNNLQVPPRLWGKMLDLIYSGNMDSAWKLCELSWPAKNPGKATFFKKFIKQLQTSPYYNDINQTSFQGAAVPKS